MSEENFNENVTPEPLQEAPQGGKGMAIASMVLGIIGIVVSCIWYLSFPCGIIAIVLGILHNKKNTKSGMATAGLVCGIIAILLAILFLVLYAVAGMAFINSAKAGYLDGLK